MDDLDAVLGFCLRIWQERDYSKKTWTDWQGNRKRRVWIAEEDKTPIGIIRGEILSPTEAWMEGLRVDPDSHSRGVGSKLYSALFDDLRNHGMRAIRTLTAIDNRPAQRLVEKHGFIRVQCLKRRARQLEAGDTDQNAEPLWSQGASLVQGILCMNRERWRSRTFLSQTNCLYCSDGVHWQAWDEDALKRHLEAGEIWAWQDPTPQAVAVVTTSPLRPAVWDVGLLEGSRRACQELLGALARRPAVPTGTRDYPPSVRTFFPVELSRLQRAAGAAGFRSDRVRHKAMYLYEWRAGMGAVNPNGRARSDR